MADNNLNGNVQGAVLHVNENGDEYRLFNPIVHTKEWQLRINLRHSRPEDEAVLGELRANCRKDAAYDKKLEDIADQGEIACIQLTLIELFEKLTKGQNPYNVGWTKPVQLTAEVLKKFTIQPAKLNKVELGNALELGKTELEKIGCPWWLIAKKIVEFFVVPNPQDITAYQLWVDTNRPNSFFWSVIKVKLVEMFGGSIHSSAFDFFRKMDYNPKKDATLEDWKSRVCKAMADAGVIVDQDFSKVEDPVKKAEIIKRNEKHLFILLSAMPEEVHNKCVMELNKYNPSAEKDPSIWRPKKLFDILDIDYKGDLFNQWYHYWTKEVEEKFKMVIARRPGGGCSSCGGSAGSAANGGKRKGFNGQETTKETIRYKNMEVERPK